MPKFLFRGSYSQEGVAEVMKEGGSARVAVATALAESAGGKLESMYFSFGGDDFYAITDLPDNVAALTIVGKLGASGVFGHVETVVLATAEELDQASKRSVKFRPPGS